MIFTCWLLSFLTVVLGQESSVEVTADAGLNKVVPDDSPQMGTLPMAAAKNCVADAEVPGAQFVNETKSQFHKGASPGESPAERRWLAFVNSAAMTVATELGDKTFFIAAIMAMRQDRIAVFAGAIGALAVMTALSAGIGLILPVILPQWYTHYAAVCLFAFFGMKLNLDAIALHRTGLGLGPSDELAEVEQSLKGSQGNHEDSKRAMMQAFTLTFLAEWGDRSQIATIALAAAKDPLGVTLGGLCGHSLCTSIAVLGGRMLAARISERTVLVVGGMLFLIFAAHGAYIGPSGEN